MELGDAIDRAIKGDRRALFAAARRFGFGIDGAEREAIFERFACGFFAPLLVQGPSTIPPDAAIEAASLMRDKRALAKLGLPPALLFLLRLRFGLYAVLAQLGARADWGALERSYARGAVTREHLQSQGTSGNHP